MVSYLVHSEDEKPWGSVMWESYSILFPKIYLNPP